MKTVMPLKPICPPPKISEKFEYRIEGLLAAVSEAVAETSDELMEKFFEGEAFTQKELIDGIHNGMNRGIITPVVCTSASELAGIDMLLKEIELLLPSPCEVYAPEAYNPAKEVIETHCSLSEPLAAYVFKTIADPFVGKMSIILALCPANLRQTAKVGKCLQRERLRKSASSTICAAKSRPRFLALVLPCPETVHPDIKTWNLNIYSSRYYEQSITILIDDSAGGGILRRISGHGSGRPHRA